MKEHIISKLKENFSEAEIKAFLEDFQLNYVNYQGSHKNYFDVHQLRYFFEYDKFFRLCKDWIDHEYRYDSYVIRFCDNTKKFLKLEAEPYSD